MYTLHLEIPAIPKSLNKAFRTNRFASNNLNKIWDRVIWEACKGQLPPEPLQNARIVIRRDFYRTLDYDGLVGSMKPVVDGLVTAGVLIDDSWKTLGVWDVSQFFRPKKDGPLLRISIYG